MDEQGDAPARRRYQTGNLTKTLGISRASLVYYEQAGLVHPERNPETGVREYDNEDVFDLFSYAALSRFGLSARQVASEAAKGPELFDEERLEGYLHAVSEKIAWYEALRGSVDRMRAIRLRERTGPQTLVRWVERHVFVPDGGEGGYLEFRATDELDLLAAAMPVSGFGILFGLDASGRTTWSWGRTIPARLAVVAGIRQHYPMQVGGCDCLTMIARVTDDATPLPAGSFDPLYRAARELGREPVGDPFVPYIFPPHAGTPFEVCLPLAAA